MSKDFRPWEPINNYRVGISEERRLETFITAKELERDIARAKAMSLSRQLTGLRKRLKELQENRENAKRL